MARCRRPESERDRFPLAGWQPAESQGPGRALGCGAWCGVPVQQAAPPPSPGPPAAVLATVTPAQP
jgi:hypothetical protein